MPREFERVGQARYSGNGFGFGQNPGDSRAQFRDLLRRGIPNHLILNPKVFVNQVIAHSGDHPPWYFWMFVAEVDWKAFYRLSDDLQTTDERPLQCRICEEILLRDTPACVRDVFCLVTDMPQPIKRREGHPSLLPVCEGRYRG